MHTTVFAIIILYPIVQRNRWFTNSDISFQSVTNNCYTANLHANVCATSGGCYIRVITLDLSALASGLADKNRPSASCSIFINTNTMLHAEPYSNYYCTCSCVYSAVYYMTSLRQRTLKGLSVARLLAINK